MTNESGLLNIRKSRQDGKPLILIVDDHPMQRKLFEIIGMELNIFPYIAASSDEAIMVATEYSLNVIFMDVKMPQMDGFECTRRIRQIHGGKNLSTPIIAVTANALLGDKEKCLNSGMNDYLSKPFSLAEFKEKLEHWLECGQMAK